ncbi:hypothetical protein ACETK8_08370 [Brevundimonas staleyi]|uniref:Cellulose synthase operon C C-terminal domain-containing protein n=1 Tax=Brevundimonas staleyi TaxID=74326 RepID=A0ABW0FSF8_9CAUL
MLIALALASVLVSDDPDGVVTTAPRGAGAVIVGAEAPTTEARPDASQVVTTTPHNLTTREQIDRWVSARTADSVPFAEDRGPQDDRQMHGFVSGSIGTNDYSQVAVGVSLPIGETGRLDMTYSQTKNGWLGYGYPGDYRYGLDGYGYGHGYAARPFITGDSFYGAPSRNSRSMSLGFRWDENDRSQRGPLRARGVAED